MKSKIDEIEQKKFRYVIDIIVMTKTQKENCKLIVEEIGKKTNTEIDVY